MQLKSCLFFDFFLQTALIYPKDIFSHCPTSHIKKELSIYPRPDHFLKYNQTYTLASKSCINPIQRSHTNKALVAFQVTSTFQTNHNGRFRLFQHRRTRQPPHLMEQWLRHQKRRQMRHAEEEQWSACHGLLRSPTPQWSARHGFLHNVQTQWSACYGLVHSSKQLNPLFVE